VSAAALAFNDEKVISNTGPRGRRATQEMAKLLENDEKRAGRSSRQEIGGPLVPRVEKKERGDEGGR